MRTDIQSTVVITPDEVEKLVCSIRGHIIQRILNIDIKVENLHQATELFWAKYEAALDEIAEMVISVYDMKKWHVAVNVLTDSIVKDMQAASEDMVVCAGCPCYQCVPDRELFKIFTGFENIPPAFFCKKSFIELRAARKIAERIFLKELSDIDENDWRDLVILKAGGQL